MKVPIIELFGHEQTMASNFIDENVTQKLPSNLQNVFLRHLNIDDVNIGIYFAQYSKNHKLAMKLLLDEHFMLNDGTVLQLMSGLLSEEVGMGHLAVNLAERGIQETLSIDLKSQGKYQYRIYSAIIIKIDMCIVALHLLI